MLNIASLVRLEEKEAHAILPCPQKLKVVLLARISTCYHSHTGNMRDISALQQCVLNRLAFKTQDTGRKRSLDCKQLLNINKPGKAVLNITKADTSLICTYFLRRFLTKGLWDESSYSISIITLTGGGGKGKEAYSVALASRALLLSRDAGSSEVNSQIRAGSRQEKANTLAAL